MTRSEEFSSQGDAIGANLDFALSLYRLDNPLRLADHQAMNDITRQEIEAKLSASEARMDARVVSIEGKIDAFLAAQAERDKATEYRIQRIESDTASIKADVKEISSQVQSIRITMAKYLGASIVIGAIASAAVGALIRFVLTTPAA